MRERNLRVISSSSRGSVALLVVDVGVGVVRRGGGARAVVFRRRRAVRRRHSS